MEKTYNNQTFNSYKEMYEHLIKEIITDPNNKDYYLSIKNDLMPFLVEEKRQLCIEYWKDLDIKFESIYDVPQLNLRGVDYQNYILPALIRCGAIPKKELEIGTSYVGRHRNAKIATWDGEHFIYDRLKFGITFQDTCNHFEDDDNFSLFVPIKET